MATTDVMHRIIAANPIKFGTAVVTWGNKNGDFKTTDVGVIASGDLTSSLIPEAWEAKLGSRFDDTDYYTGGV